MVSLLSPPYLPVKTRPITRVLALLVDFTNSPGVITDRGILWLLQQMPPVVYEPTRKELRYWSKVSRVRPYQGHTRKQHLKRLKRLNRLNRYKLRKALVFDLEVMQ